jgi:CheY-like chemotaxis protein
MTRARFAPSVKNGNRVDGPGKTGAVDAAEAAMRKILVVDDEPLVCDVITDCFGDDAPEGGVQPSIANTLITCMPDGLSAARTLESCHYDLILIDVMVPRLSAFRLAEMAARRGTAVLLLSGHPVANEKLDLFGWPHVRKPFSMSRLCAESSHAISHAADNIGQVLEAADRMHASAAALPVMVAAAGFSGGDARR